MTNTNSSNEKTMCILAYIIFFLPLLVIPDSQAGKFHANQGLLVLLLSIAANVLSIIPFIGGILQVLGGVFALVLVIMGMINASNNEMKELPLIGQIQIIK